MAVETTPQYGLTQEQLDFLEVIRQMVVEKVTPRAAEIDQTGEYPEDIRKLFADHDLFGLPFDEQYGGTGTGDLTGLTYRFNSASGTVRPERKSPV